MAFAAQLFTAGLHSFCGFQSFHGFHGIVWFYFIIGQIRVLNGCLFYFEVISSTVLFIWNGRLLTAKMFILNWLVSGRPVEVDFAVQG